MIYLTKTAGILGPIAELLGVIMNAIFKFTSSFGVLNIGLCIILFTLVIKVIMFPLTLKQQKSSKLTAIMQPEIQAIQKKYKGKTDNDSMMKMNVETKAVYEKYGTSMTGGCLQLLIQMPILFALYRVIYNIPAYVSSVRVYFDNVVTPLQGQPDFINKISSFADACKLPIDRYDYTIGDKVVDLLYKFTPSQWASLADTFPSISDTISANAAKIEELNSFLGINLATSPGTAIMDAFSGNGSMLAAVTALIIPVAAGLSQWYSTKLMTANQPSMNEENSAAASMKTMNTMMPLMSVFFCFSFAAGIGVYWVASSVFMIIQQVIVNKHLEKVDVDEMVRKNVEKANAKRAKKGLPPTRINETAVANYKNIQANAEKEEAKRAEKLEKSKEIEKESTSYYNSNAKPGSLAAKANMVAKYNEKNEKKNNK